MKENLINETDLDEENVVNYQKDNQDAVMDEEKESVSILSTQSPKQEVVN